MVLFYQNQVLIHSDTPLIWFLVQVPCSKLATGQIDDVVHGTDRKPVLPIVIAPTNVVSRHCHSVFRRLLSSCIVDGYLQHVSSTTSMADNIET